MKVFVVRHSVPEDGDDYEENPDPPLSKEGREIAEALGKWMLEAEVLPNFIWVSPKLRTQETAEIIRDAIGLPEEAVEVKGSMDSDMSIRKMVLKAAGDKSVTRLMIVSHHESIEHGLRVLNRDPWVHLDQFAMGELRQIDVDREDGSWEEHLRMMPSDLGGKDHY
jgi:phosphohistidine phosphatase